MTPTVWLMGGANDARFDELAAALEAHGCQLERLSPRQTEIWREEAALDQVATMAPNLIIVADDLALADDAALLRTLRDREPWRFLPLVVVAGDEDAERCARAYELRASSWAVLPVDPDRCRRAAAIFARYWLDTTLVPNVHYFA